jgi:hypothetical protein
MTTKPLELKRGAYGLVAAVLTMVVAVASLLPGYAAAGQVQERSIKLSDSSPSGGSITSGVGSGTNVSYTVTFTPATSGNIGGIVVDVCDNTPLVEDTSCTYPTDFNWGSATPTLTAGYTGMGAGWTAAGIAGGAGANYQVLELSNASPQAVVNTTPISFEITGVTNPSEPALTYHAFYARILTFDTSGNMTAQYTTTGTTRVASTSLTNMVDYGGVAMSVTTPITITARVMESLSLCTSAIAPDSSCAGANSPSIIIGHGGNNVLDASSAPDTNSAYAQLSTNALNGAIIRMKASTTCGGLSRDGGATCDIPAVGDTATALAAGTANFGMRVADGVAAASGGSGTVNNAAPYDDPANYAMDITTADDNVLSTYGDTVASSPGAVNSMNIQFIFAATASNTTPAGIYTTYESLIGTGTF